MILSIIFPTSAFNNTIVSIAVDIIEAVIKASLFTNGANIDWLKDVAMRKGVSEKATSKERTNLPGPKRLESLKEITFGIAS